LKEGAAQVKTARWRMQARRPQRGLFRSRLPENQTR
jgi:hypothetical protein